METQMEQRVAESANDIRERLQMLPDVAVILGSGLGKLADELKERVEIPYEDIPHFPRSTVASHAGKLVCGKLGDKPILAFSGRFHFYEGYEMEETAYPVRVLKQLGVRKLILTNAAGGLDHDMRPGNFMLITDHIKLCAESPLLGPENPSAGKRFVDLTNVYDRDMAEIARDTAKSLGILLREGVYAFMAGPQFETPAEIRALRALGANAVGMSTVAEVIAAAQAGIRVLALSCITNLGAGMLKAPVSDSEVVETAEMAAKDFARLITGVAARI